MGPLLRVALDREQGCHERVHFRNPRTTIAILMVLSAACGGTQKVETAAPASAHHTHALGHGETLPKTGVQSSTSSAVSTSRDFSPRHYVGERERFLRAVFVAAAKRAVVAPATNDAKIVTNYHAPAVVVPSQTGAMPCGGTDYPPCYVAQRESGNTYTAYNPTGCGGSGCYGRWQFSGAWAGKLGLPLDLSQATPAQQDNAARLLWNHGAGCSNWASC